jgi:hypothetical protein
VGVVDAAMGHYEVGAPVVVDEAADGGGGGRYEGGRWQHLRQALL